MFHPSASRELQGLAIHAINEKWGVHKSIQSKSNQSSSSSSRNHWIGRETIGIPVCKKKYAPFDFRKKVLKDGKVHVQVVRMYGCTCHSHLRAGTIKRFGERKGWEPFGQWSLKKAQILSKKLQERLSLNAKSSLIRRIGSAGSTSDSSEVDENGSYSTSFDSNSRSHSHSTNDNSFAAWKKLCHNGNCTWKMKHRYDDVVEEIHERSQGDS